MNEITRRGLIFATATAAAYGLLAGVERLCLSAFADNEEPQDDPGPMKIVKFADNGTRRGTYTLARVRKSKSEWKKQLTPLQYDVTRGAATEFAFSGALYDQHASGLYRCIDCDSALFDSKANSTPERAGRASGSRSLEKMCARKKTSTRGCCERK